MKTILHKANTRGHANHGWLNSYHSFSFGEYYNPDRMNFGTLRVASMGFGKHPHDNMEIVSIPLSGDLKHQDSTGRNEIIKQHDVQIMSAGKGIAHSEVNANKDKEVKFLQIWVMPKEKNIEPRYEQKSFLPEHRINQLLNVVAPDNADAVWINQDAWFSLGNFTAGFSINYDLHKPSNGVYIFILSGSLIVNDQVIESRDGLGINDIESISIQATTDAEIVLIEVPM
jgi:quercetin 2,3-dioxygenase